MSSTTVLGRILAAMALVGACVRADPAGAEVGAHVVTIVQEGATPSNEVDPAFPRPSPADEPDPGEAEHPSDPSVEDPMGELAASEAQPVRELLADATSKDRAARSAALEQLMRDPDPAALPALAEALSMPVEDREEQEELWEGAARAAQGFVAAGIDLPRGVEERLEELKNTEATVMTRCPSRGGRACARYRFRGAADSALSSLEILRARRRLDDELRGKSARARADFLASQAWTGETQGERFAARERLEGLGALGAEASVPFARRASESLQRRMASYFGRLHAQTGAPAAVDGLLRLAESPEQSVWGRAMLELGKTGSARAAAALVDRLERDEVPSRDFEQSAVATIGELGYTPGIPLLVEKLADASASTGFAAARALEALGSRGVGALVSAARGPELRARRVAVRQLSGIGAPAAQEAVRRYLREHPEDPASEWIRERRGDE